MQTSQVIDESFKVGVALTLQQAEHMVRYSTLLLEWNKKFNLTAITDESAVLTLHFMDSLTVLSVLSALDEKSSQASLRILDVGTGAGFPGLPMKIARPDLDVTLIDSTTKKVGFCAEVVQQLGLRGARAMHARSEELAHEPAHRERYDLVVARAVAAMPTLVEYLLPFVRIGGLCVAMKGGAAEQETADAAVAIRTLGGVLERVQAVALPGVPDKRALVVIKKTTHTPAKFPRPAGAPRNAPLK